MIVDTSALVAILRDESEARRFAIALANAQERRMSAANFVETAIVIDGSGDPVAGRLFDDLVRESRIHIEPVTEEQARIARSLPRLWQGKRPCCCVELWRLLRLCISQDFGRALALQGTGLYAYRYSRRDFLKRRADACWLALSIPHHHCLGTAPPSTLSSRPEDCKAYNRPLCGQHTSLYIQEFWWNRSNRKRQGA
jgi:ribonuclease VapC